MAPLQPRSSGTCYRGGLRLGPRDSDRPRWPHCQNADAPDALRRSAKSQLFGRRLGDRRGAVLQNRARECARDCRPDGPRLSWNLPRNCDGVAVRRSERPDQIRRGPRRNRLRDRVPRRQRFRLPRERQQLPDNPGFQRERDGGRRNRRQEFDRHRRPRQSRQLCRPARRGEARDRNPTRGRQRVRCRRQYRRSQHQLRHLSPEWKHTEPNRR